MKLNLSEKKSQIALAATQAFNEIINAQGRIDDKKRTGVQVLVREPDTRNLVLISVLEPPEHSKFFAVEKAVRSHLKNDYASQNSEHPDSMEFAGSVTVEIDGVLVQASTSGMKAEEDVTISIRVLAAIFDVDSWDIIHKI